jgi:hypothetical protein
MKIRQLERVNLCHHTDSTAALDRCAQFIQRHKAGRTVQRRFAESVFTLLQLLKQALAEEAQK